MNYHEVHAHIFLRSSVVAYVGIIEHRGMGNLDGVPFCVRQFCQLVAPGVP